MKLIYLKTTLEYIERLNPKFDFKDILIDSEIKELNGVMYFVKTIN